MKEFALCGVCRLSHDQGRPHIYTKRHTTALATLLDKELRRMAALATWLESHSRSLASTQEQSAQIAAGIAAHGHADERQNGAHSREERRDRRSLSGTRGDDGTGDRVAIKSGSDDGASVACEESRKRSRWCRFCDADVAEDSVIGGWQQWVRHISSGDHMTSVRAFWAANCSGRGVVAADTIARAAALAARLAASAVAAASAPASAASYADAVNSDGSTVPAGGAAQAAARDVTAGAAAKRRAKKQRGSNYGGLEIKQTKETWRAFVLPPAAATAAAAVALPSPPSLPAPSLPPASRREFEAERRAQRRRGGRERQHRGGKERQQRGGEEKLLKLQEEQRNEGPPGGREDDEAKESKHGDEQPAGSGEAMAQLMPHAVHPLPSQPSQRHDVPSLPVASPVAAPREVVLVGSFNAASGVQAFELRPYVPKRLKR
ncbi:unnamed protein product [Closterium sp. Naga37s-1]|nr:unnamed protein product [Closterium sp. Naga37s-1]